MSLTPEQYMSLSNIAYTDFLEDDEGNKIDIGRSIDDLMNSQDNKRIDTSNIVNQAANKLVENWTLINYQDNNPSSGFARAAFKNEQTREIVFTFRVTEQDVKDHLIIPEDFFTDAQLAFPEPH